MKKLLLPFATSVVITATSLGGFAGAASCDGLVTLTGPGSNNTVDCKELNDINLTCNNNVWVGTVNNQTGTSGSGDVSGNTAGGTVATGTVVNTNGQQFTIGTSCAHAPCIPAVTAVVCPPVAVAPAVAPGAGAAAPATPATLPYTSNDSLQAVILTSLAAAAGTFTISRMSVAVLRRMRVNK